MCCVFYFFILTKSEKTQETSGKRVKKKQFLESV